MSSLGSDFAIIFDALTDDIHKAIVRMRWQDMHYNHLAKTLNNFTIDNLFENINLEKKINGMFFHQVRSEISIHCKPESELFSEYTFSLYVLNDVSIDAVITIKFRDLFLFNRFYFDEKETNDIMFGLVSGLDFRVTDPLLAAVKYTQKSVK